ncbi:MULTISPECIES: peroxiredoxin-like family protein [Mycolicibacterium]|jgi:peroxiredoxin|uniref:peroxiredoxin-like family protein n=1 Tax=Mycolicibacterium TaxID=1866885 RepID=UPI00059ECDE4|nr:MULTISPECIES: peroxiredoxin-like family protein [Mycolicibacterium]MDW5612873.1 peroxiredoxin-like family protein [Mycolicibacterium sp. D5.8-2]
MSEKLKRGAIVTAREYPTITGERVTVPAAAGVTHLQFRRFAGCPICHLHLRSFATRHEEISAAGITEVVFFHSAASALQGYQALLPFAVVADPDRKVYREFGVDAHLRAVAHPRALLAAFRGYAKIVGRHDDPDNAGVGGGDGSTHLSLPADVLIVPDGAVVTVHYGRHADDQWTVDDLLDLNRGVAGKDSP